MNAIKRFIDILKSPLIPVRLFAVEDDFDFSWTDEPSGYYDEDGNYLGDDADAAEAAAASHDDPSLNPDNWSENSDDFGDVSIQTDGNGNILGASYRDPETGEWKDSGLSGYQEAFGRSTEGHAKQAMKVFGASMTPETLAALNSGNGSDVSTMLERASVGDASAVALATVMTGTMPDVDSLRELGYSDEQILTVAEFAEAMTQALAEGNDLNAAWKLASNKTGDPYGTNERDRALIRAILNTSSLCGVGTDLGRQLLVGALTAINRIRSNKGTASDSDSEDKTPTASTASTASAKTSEPAARSEPKSDPVITGNPFDKGSPDISIPKGPLEGTPLSGTGLPGHESEPTKEDAEDRGFSNDDSGSDTMEETSQDAPTSGLGGDTFSNPNDPSNNKCWGLGEEDPNRANYDVDKWNRGMERVSTDVVSDEKCKAFIKKTFKDDPVLIKTVKIMKTLK